jgi:hypothetical protein
MHAKFIAMFDLTHHITLQECPQPRREREILHHFLVVHSHQQLDYVWV